jgi:hypothetical protein
MSKMYAYCGLDCAVCPAYVATQAGDGEAQMQLMAQWREQYDPNMTIAGVTCDGCTSSGRLGGYCEACPLRSCGLARGVVNCAVCTDYAGCQTLETFFAQAPEVRTQLEALRKSIL